MSTVNVTAEALRGLFVAAGFPAAKDWDKDKCEESLAKIEDLIDDEAEMDEENKALAAQLMVAVGKGDLVEVDWGTAAEAAPEQEAQATPPAAKKKSKKKEKTVEKATKDTKTSPNKGGSSKAEKPETKVTKVTVKGGGTSKYMCGNHASTRVIHWLGSKGYEFDAVQKVLKHYKLDKKISQGNAKARLSVGKNKDRAKPAELTAAEEKELKRIIKA